MNYKVLYRKYRPDSFNNLIGQENIVKILTNSVKSNKLSHAYIFSGPRGTGKTSSAKIFAKSLNCLSNVEGNPCGLCDNCLNVNSNDIIEIDAASNNGVNEIREITNNIKLAPNSFKYKVYIIDEVHMLSQSAFNALLLTLEEPPSHVIFILATTNIENVPVTILSRCQRFDFKKITLNDIVSRLTFICEQENIEITNDAIFEIARLSDGGLRDSLSMLDQLSIDNRKIDIDVVIDNIGGVSSSNIEKIINYLDENNYKEIQIILDNLSNNAIDSKLFLKSIIDGISNSIKDLIQGKKTSRLTIDQYKNLVFDIVDLINKITVSIDTFTLLQIILFSYIDIASSDVINSINKICPDDSNEIVELISSESTEKIVNDSEFTSEINELSEDNISNKENLDNSVSIVDDQDNSYKQLLGIRINNCFTEATKESKNKCLDLWDSYKNKMTLNLKGVIIDTDVCMASSKIIVISTKRESDLEELINNYKLIEGDFNQLVGENFKLIFIINEYWLKLREEYVNNIKNGYQYKLKEEINNDINSLREIVYQIFDKNKIEEG